MTTDDSKVPTKMYFVTGGPTNSGGLATCVGEVDSDTDNGVFTMEWKDGIMVIRKDNKE